MYSIEKSEFKNAYENIIIGISNRLETKYNVQTRPLLTRKNHLSRSPSSSYEVIL